MFFKAYNPAPIETAKTIKTTKTTETAETTKTTETASVPIIECPYTDEPYTFTGLSSPNLRPYKIITTDVSANGLLKPPSRNDQNRRRNSSPIGRDFGKEITDNFLLSDSWPSWEEGEEDEEDE